MKLLEHLEKFIEVHKIADQQQKIVLVPPSMYDHLIADSGQTNIKARFEPQWLQGKGQPLIIKGVPVFSDSAARAPWIATVGQLKMRYAMD